MGESAQICGKQTDAESIPLHQILSVKDTLF